VPLLGGYWFLGRCNYFRFRFQLLDGYRLLFASALAALGFGVAARLGTIILYRLYPGIQDRWFVVCPPIDYPYSGTAFGAFLVAVALPELLNLLPSPLARMRNLEYAKSAAVNLHGDALDRLLFRATKEGQPVVITLENRKVYIGFVADAPNLEREGRYLGLLPVTSGYRDSETLAFKRTTNSSFLIDSEGGQETVVIPVGDIKIAELFDFPAHTSPSAQGAGGGADDEGPPGVAETSEE